MNNTEDVWDTWGVKIAYEIWKKMKKQKMV